MGIKYPQTEAHKIKDGHGKAFFQSVGGITNKEIAEAVEGSKEQAKKMITKGVLSLIKVTQSSLYSMHGSREDNTMLVSKKRRPASTFFGTEECFV